MIEHPIIKVRFKDKTFWTRKSYLDSYITNCRGFLFESYEAADGQTIEEGKPSAYAAIQDGKIYRYHAEIGTVSELEPIE